MAFSDGLSKLNQDFLGGPAYQPTQWWVGLLIPQNPNVVPIPTWLECSTADYKRARLTQPWQFEILGATQNPPFLGIEYATNRSNAKLGPVDDADKKYAVGLFDAETNGNLIALLPAGGFSVQSPSFDSRWLVTIGRAAIICVGIVALPIAGVTTVANPQASFRKAAIGHMVGLSVFPPGASVVLFNETTQAIFETRALAYGEFQIFSLAGNGYPQFRNIVPIKFTGKPTTTTQAKGLRITTAAGQLSADTSNGTGVASTAADPPFIYYYFDGPPGQGISFTFLAWY